MGKNNLQLGVRCTLDFIGSQYVESGGEMNVVGDGQGKEEGKEATRWKER